jgi:hypothetical protein
MAFNLGNLGDENGYIYEKLKSGAINSLPNTPEVAMKIMNRANKSRLIYTKYTEAALTEGNFTDQFQDDVYGSRYYLNAEVAAPIGDITGALDITKYVIAPTKCYKDQVTIDVDGEIDITRYSFNHVVLLSPATGTEDTLNYMTHDFQPGDLVFFTLADDSTDTITINPNTVDNGNFKCQNAQPIILSGAGACALFIRDGSQSQITGGRGFLREIGRPNQQSLDIANKNLTSGGGNYYVLDVATAEGSRIDTKQGLVILEGNDSTLSSPWNIWGESVDSAKSQGTELEFILNSPLYTDATVGRTLNIFGIEIPDIYCKNYNFVVKAWYDNTDIDPLNWEWKAKMYVDQLKETWTPLVIDGGSGEPTPIFTANPATIEVDSPAYAIRTISHNENTIANVKFFGHLVSATTSVGGGAGSPEVAASFCIDGWIPNQNLANGSAFFVCPFYDPADIGLVMGLVTVIVDTSIRIKVINGFTLNVGDYIDLGSISYLAENP